MYLHNTAGLHHFQDGMFDKNRRKKLEKLRMDRRKQVWYDIYVGRLMKESRPFSAEVEYMIKKYNKLVRDRIPEIIESSGRACVTEILSDEDYLKMLDAKLDEELAEYHADQNIEELADLMEVIRACAVARGYTVEELEQVRAEKAAKRGGFEKKILLKEVVE